MHRSTDRLSCFLLAVVILGAAPLWAENAQPGDKGKNEKASNGELSGGPLVVHKNPFCFCCKKWMAHLHRKGIKTSTDNTTGMSRVKGQWAIPEGMHSCHTAVLNDKYVFEGHVPARFIRKYLSDPPEGSYGLTVPGMPKGSPGMYEGGDFEPYNIYLLMRDGDYRFYVRVEKPESR